MPKKNNCKICGKGFMQYNLNRYCSHECYNNRKKPPPKPKKKERTLTDLYEEIWAERPHLSQVSGKALYGRAHSQWRWQFAHLLAKGHYPAYKFRKENIMLMTPKEHENQEKFPIFMEEQERLRLQYHEEFGLK